MRSCWLNKRGTDRLIIFCNGWGMDEQPFSPLGSCDYDVLMFYDYSDLSPDLDLEGLFREYGELVVIAWSMGVWAGQQLFAAHREQLQTALAINGSLSPIDDHFGIPEETVRATLENFDEKQRLKFYHRMCRDRELYRRFLQHQPLRSVDSQRKELTALMETAGCKGDEKPIYRKALVADHDFIMPTANQLNFWPEKMVRRVDGYHFLFYSYSSWDEIVAEAVAVGKE